MKRLRGSAASARLDDDRGVVWTRKGPWRKQATCVQRSACESDTGYFCRVCKKHDELEIYELPVRRLRRIGQVLIYEKQVKELVLVGQTARSECDNVRQSAWNRLVRLMRDGARRSRRSVPTGLRAWRHLVALCSPGSLQRPGCVQ